MGTRADVMVMAPTDRVEDLLGVAVAKVEALEAKWSRFRPRSEISRMNDLSGRPVIVSEETCDLVALGLIGWKVTGGLFDPCLLEPLRDLGYDRDFSELPATEGVGEAEPPAGLARPGPGAAGQVAVDRVLNAVTLPPGIGFDPGGIGKGHAADLVCAELMSREALAVLVNLGGDQRVAGASPAGGWRTRVENPLDPDGAPLGSLRLAGGAVATTTSYRRRWYQGDVVRHHVLDPRTCLPSETDLASVTVLAGEAWRAEVLAKAAFVAGAEAGRDLLEAQGVSGLLVGHDATLVEVGTRAAA